MKLKLFLKYGTLLFSILLCVGETIILFKTDKYYPLSLDDYFACACLAGSAYAIKQSKYLPLLVASWAFVFGNMYAMLFNRLDPIYGSGERIGLLIAVTIYALVFLLFSLKEWLKTLKITNRQ